MILCILGIIDGLVIGVIYVFLGVYIGCLYLLYKMCCVMVFFILCLCN